MIFQFLKVYQNNIAVISKINCRLSDCKGRALRKVQEKDSARVKGEAP